MRQWPMAQQRLVGVRQDHSLSVGIVLDLFPELLGLLEPPAHGVLAVRAPQLVEIHGHTTLAALHPLDHRLIAGLPLEADRYRPGFEYVLQRSEVLGLGGDRQGLGDLFDEPLLVGGSHVTQQLDGVGGQLEVVAVDARGHTHACLPLLVRCPWLWSAERMDRASSFDAAL
jgi:hypothetical protein